ncbi:MAG: hypothetical protein ACE15D_19300 [Candidatus Eisenbacteria bacterium]|nr:hypothetical protein [Candidatus Eisenbacteria bacterium]
MTRKGRDLLDRLIAPLLAAAIAVGLFVIVLSSGGCGSETAPAESALAPDHGSIDDPSHALVESGTPTISGPASLSITAFIDASKPADLKLGKIAVHFDPWTLPRSMPITLTVTDASQNRFRVEPATTRLGGAVRVSVALTCSPAGETDRTSTVRFYNRTSASPLWVPLATRRTLVDVYAYSNRLGEFWATNFTTGSSAGMSTPGTPTN